MIEIVYPMRRKAAPGPSDGLLHCEHLDAPMVLANLAALPRTGYSGTTPLEYRFSECVNRRRTCSRLPSASARLARATDAQTRHLQREVPTRI